MNKLVEITPQYRSFVDDQVLTSGQLNEFIAYFEDQDRLTRVCLTGVGVACGFVVSLDETEGALITISQGCGITTDGDLLKLQDDIAESSEKTIDLESITYSHFKIFEDDKAEYSHFKNGNNTIDLLELIPDDKADEGEGDLPLDQTDLTDKVVVLYLESYPKAADICTTTNCDNQGQPNVQNLKVLLVTKDDVENIVNSKDAIYTKHDVYEALINLPQTAIKKVVLNSSLGPNNNIGSYSAMAASYKARITDAKTNLQVAYSGLFDGFSEILSIDNGMQTTVLNQIDNLDDFTNTEGIQYRYDLARDLSDTYNEIAALLLKLKTECCPDIEAFPKHLLLGSLTPTEMYPEFRHDFYHAPVNNDYDEYLRTAKSLATRAAILLDNFSLSMQNQIEITPSQTCGSLGEKAIPVYYDVDRSLLNTWDFVKTENYKQRFNVSYHKTNLAPNSWVQTPLRFELDCYDFYRIEGHFGRAGLASRDVINTMRDNNALDFDCTIFDLKNQAQAFTAFVKDHPSISHKSGVPRGGTFVLVTEDDEVVADFCLSYKVAAKGDEASCCSLMECTYPWISSLKYLNNLARSLKGTQSTNVPMPQEYRLQIIEYRINGERLINTTTTISVPLGRIFLRRVHAITEALNKRFDKGVVFDFNESQKRFVITRAKEDTFVIRLRDVTQANNNPIYTYSNSGMYRNNLVFRPDAMRCRDLKGYNANFYEKLQKSIAPVNKDDDYGRYDEKWAKWYSLRDRLVTNTDIVEANLTRMITNIEELPPEIRTIIPDMKGDFRGVLGTAVNLNFQLDGDWVNGVWVNTFMLNHHRANRRNTHDDIVLFVNLRKALHNETGVTKLSIYVTGAPYTTDFDEVIEQYNSFADFYFGSPRGINAIQI